MTDDPNSSQYVAYLRVSTEQQSRLRLGVEIQQEAVARHVAFVGVQVVQSFTEVETDKGF